jgi:hypothetical protein
MGIGPLAITMLGFAAAQVVAFSSIPPWVDVGLHRDVTSRIARIVEGTQPSHGMLLLQVNSTNLMIILTQIDIDHLVAPVPQALRLQLAEKMIHAESSNTEHASGPGTLLHQATKRSSSSNPKEEDEDELTSKEIPHEPIDIRGALETSLEEVAKQVSQIEERYKKADIHRIHWTGYRAAMAIEVNAPRWGWAALAAQYKIPLPEELKALLEDSPK